jgi:hypothetical protein
MISDIFFSNQSYNLVYDLKVIELPKTFDNQILSLLRRERLMWKHHNKSSQPEEGWC